MAELRAVGDVPLELLAQATGNGGAGAGHGGAAGRIRGRFPVGCGVAERLDWGNMRLTEDSRAERLFIASENVIPLPD